MPFAGIHFPPFATKMQNRFLRQRAKMKKRIEIAREKRAVPIRFCKREMGTIQIDACQRSCTGYQSSHEVDPPAFQPITPDIVISKTVLLLLS
jgi:hypothetical protein